MSSYRDLTPRQLTQRLFSTSLLYGLGMFCVRSSTFLLIPLYWRKLTPEDFGIIGLSQVLSVVLVPIFTLGLQGALQRFYYEYESDDQKYLIGALSVVSVGTSLIISLMIEYFGDQLFPMIFKTMSYRPYFQLALWTAFFSNFSFLPLAIFRIREQTSVFNKISVTSTLMEMGLILILLYGFDLGLKGYFYGSLFHHFAWAIVYGIFLWKNSKLTTTVTYYREPLTFSIPLAFSAVLEGISGIMDRYFLEKNASLSILGKYSLGNQFGSSYSLFNRIFKTAWIPFLYRTVSERKDGPDILALLSVYSVTVLAIPALAIALLSKEFISFFGKSEYADIYVYVPGFVLGNYLMSFATAVGRGLDLSKSNNRAPLVPISAAITGIVSATVLVPIYGGLGALAAFIITAFVKSGVQIVLACIAYPRPTMWSKWFKLICIVSIGFALGYTIETGNLLANFMLKSSWIVLTALVLFVSVFGKQNVVSWVNEVRQNIFKHKS
ncbi:MAG: lipopolysaccharide biosynthesis protein [Bdellovibrionales bacterium]|nr:lipopolysaccharide biosynthesis protein [Bdellovibrionales bacterium]